MPRAKNVENKAGLSPDAAAQFVGKTEFEAFKANSEAMQSKMLDLLENLSTAAKTDIGEVPKEKPTQTDSGEPNGFLPPQYQAIFEKYFDPTDGFTGRITFPETDDQGRPSGGFTFTLFVPNKFSNAGDAYLQMNKVDLRTVALQASDIPGGIEKWCSRVAKQLNYKKELRTK